MRAGFRDSKSVANDEKRLNSVGFDLNQAELRSLRNWNKVQTGRRVPNKPDNAAIFPGKNYPNRILGTYTTTRKVGVPIRGEG